MCLKLYLPKHAVLSLDQGSTATINYVCVCVCGALCVRAWGILEVKMRRRGSFGHRRVIGTTSRDEPITLHRFAPAGTESSDCTADSRVYTPRPLKFTVR